MTDKKYLIGTLPGGGKTLSTQQLADNLEIKYTKTLVDKRLLEEILTILEKINDNGKYNILIGKIKLALNV